MSKRESIGRYIHIIKKLRRGPARFNDLINFLEVQGEIDGCNYSISQRQFQRDIIDIGELYNIHIEYKPSVKGYVIIQEDDSEMDNRIFEAFDTFNALNAADRISNHIHFENRRPQGTENLYGILHAIKNKYEIMFTYTKFWDEEISQRKVQPFALKEFKNRWYIVGNDLKDNKIKIFALDRLSLLEISIKHFALANEFDVNGFFDHCFGIVAPKGGNPEEVILSFTPFQGKYIKSLPLHHSQQVLVDNEEEFKIKLTIYITHDFVMEVLSFADQVKVLQPKELINKVRTALCEALKAYQE